MIYFIALIPATALTIAGYFALFLSNRSEGAFRSFGKYLGFWAFTLAGLIVLGAIFAAAHGTHNGGRMAMRGMHDGMHGPWGHGPWAHRPWEHESRFFGSHDQGPLDDGRPDEAQPGGNPPPPAGAPNATPHPAPPAAH
jgi:hypothetical protein